MNSRGVCPQVSLVRQRKHGVEVWWFVGAGERVDGKRENTRIDCLVQFGERENKLCSSFIARRTL